MKTALITGIAGQDGSYLAKLLLEKGYKVYGATRRNGSGSLWRHEFLGISGKIEIVELELLEQNNIRKLVKTINPDEIYNLAAQSFVATSFNAPEYTAEADGIAVLYFLEAIKELNPKIKFYQASTSEMFGKVQEIPQTETTPLYPRSPYGVAKLYGHWITKNYRESYNLFACSGILFNHESPLRGPEFVTRKITIALSKIKAGKQDVLELGNIESQRDWGFAGDYVEGMYLMLQQKEPDDYVLATNRTTTIKKFIEMVGNELDFDIKWEGKDEKEVGIDKKSGKTIIKINPDFYRPCEVDLLIGNPAKAEKVLGWKPKVQLEELVKMMVEADVERNAKDHNDILKKADFGKNNTKDIN
ncbi:MAG: GDP-mannose 4,6-dehydratase [Rickettsiales bacterium]|nr:MAG: GDP-mannose 4,6-dehydratase [Rickettsiales bacterium]